jgi:hypothetical protein
MPLQQVAQSLSHIQTDGRTDKCTPVKCQCASGECINSSSSQETLVDIAANSFERRLGDTEVSYFLPARESGVNDM